MIANQLERNRNLAQTFETRNDIEHIFDNSHFWLKAFAAIFIDGQEKVGQDSKYLVDHILRNFNTFLLFTVY